MGSRILQTAVLCGLHLSLALATDAWLVPLAARLSWQMGARRTMPPPNPFHCLLATPLSLVFSPLLFPPLLSS